MKKLFGAALAAALMCCVSGAAAVEILNTGPTDGSTGAIYNNGVNDYQTYARLVHLDRSYDITDVQGLFSVDRAGMLRVSVYSNDRSIPSELLYTATTFAEVSKAVKWLGVSGVNWSLAAGDYWFAFGADIGGFYGNTPSYNYTDRPLATAHINHFYSDWFRHGKGYNGTLALKVSGNVAAVPEAGPLAMLAVAVPLAGLLARGRKPISCVALIAAGRR